MRFNPVSPKRVHLWVLKVGDCFSHDTGYWMILDIVARTPENRVHLCQNLHYDERVFETTFEEPIVVTPVPFDEYSWAQTGEDFELKQILEKTNRIEK